MTGPRSGPEKLCSAPRSTSSIKILSTGEFEKKVIAQVDDTVALHHTNRTYICTCITLSTLYGLQTLDLIEVHIPKAMYARISILHTN